MLPFPIMNTYGNTVIKSTIKKLTSSVQTIGLLYTNGNLYMRGTNSQNAFGMAGGSPTTWTLVKTDVDDVWCGQSHTIVLLKNGEYWCTGFYRSLGLGSNPGTWVKYQSLHNLLTSTGTTILQLCTGLNGTQAVLSNNAMYSIGYNGSCSLCPTGNNTSLTAWTASLTSVKKVSYCMNSSLVITTGNALRVIGNSDNYKLGSGNGVLTSWTTPTLPSGYSYVIDVHENYRDTFVYAAADSTGTNARFLLAGYNGLNTLGLVPYDNISSVQTYKAGTGSVSLKTFGSGWNTTAYNGLYTDGTSLYTSGNAGPRIGSSTPKTTGFTAVPYANSYSGLIDDFCTTGSGATGGCTFVLTNNNLYAIGATEWLGSDIYSLTLQNTPE